MADEIELEFKDGKWIGDGLHGETKTDVGFGIYDTVDNCWLGDDNGPVLYGDLVIARISAQVQGVRLGYEPTRLQHRVYDYKPVRLRDTVNAKMDNVTALKLIEDGGAL